MAEKKSVGSIIHDKSRDKTDATKENKGQCIRRTKKLHQGLTCIQLFNLCNAKNS